MSLKENDIVSEAAYEAGVAEERVRILRHISEIDFHPCLCSKDGNCEYNKGFKKAIEIISNI